MFCRKAASCGKPAVRSQNVGAFQARLPKVRLGGRVKGQAAMGSLLLSRCRTLRMKQQPGARAQSAISSLMLMLVLA